MKIRFVIADDAPFIREILRSLLEREGHICVGEAANGEEALLLVAQTLPDLLICDLVMPVKTGLHTIKAVRDKYPITKIIACSTLDDQQQINKAIALGADQYISKPFSSTDVIKVVNGLFSRIQEVNK